MRIALISDCYAPRIGGIETQVRALAQHLVAAGHEVLVITATSPAPPVDGNATNGGDGETHTFASPSPLTRIVREVDDTGAEIWRLPCSLWPSVPVNPCVRRTLESLLKNVEVAHVHMGVVSPFAVMGANAATRTVTPTVLTWHCIVSTPLLSERTAPRVFAPIRRWHEAGHVFTAVSRVAARPIEHALRASLSHTIPHTTDPDHRNRWDSRLVTVMPNLIDATRWALPHPRDNASNHDTALSDRTRTLRVACASRITRRKRVHVLPEMIRYANDLLSRTSHPVSIRLDVFGDGPGLARLRRTSRLLPITWHGSVDHSTLREVYATSDLWLSPVILEAFGIGALEARTSGLPIVFRRGSGIAQFATHGIDALCVDSDKEMARTLARLAAAPEWVAQLKRQSRRALPQFTWDVGIETVVATYRRAIDATGD